MSYTYRHQLPVGTVRYSVGLEIHGTVSSMSDPSMQPLDIRRLLHEYRKSDWKIGLHLRVLKYVKQAPDKNHWLCDCNQPKGLRRIKI